MFIGWQRSLLAFSRSICFGAALLVTGMYTTSTKAVFADSTNLKQETKQNANCLAVGASSSVSEYHVTKERRIVSITEYQKLQETSTPH